MQILAFLFGDFQPLGNDEFTKLLMRYVLKDERGSNFNGTGDRSSNPERSFEDYLQLDQSMLLSHVQLGC